LIGCGVLLAAASLFVSGNDPRGAWGSVPFLGAGAWILGGAFRKFPEFPAAGSADAASRKTAEGTNPVLGKITTDLSDPAITATKK
jgi:hypothetical protein